MNSLISALVKGLTSAILKEIRISQISIIHFYIIFSISYIWKQELINIIVYWFILYYFYEEFLDNLLIKFYCLDSEYDTGIFIAIIIMWGYLVFAIANLYKIITNFKSMDSTIIYHSYSDVFNLTVGNKMLLYSVISFKLYLSLNSKLKFYVEIYKSTISQKYKLLIPNLDLK